MNFSVLPNDLFTLKLNEATPEDIRNPTKRDKPFEFGHTYWRR